MSKIRALNLEDIYAKSPTTRFQSLKVIGQLQDKYIRNVLSDNPFYKKISTQYGEDGIKDFIKMIQLKRIEDIYPDDLAWLYVLNSSIIKKRKSVRKDGSLQFFNPEQNQFASIKKGKGNVLVLMKSSHNVIIQRHKTRQLNKKIAIFGQLPIFGDLSHLQLTSVCQKVYEQKYEKSNVIYFQDQSATKLYIVKQGMFVMNRYSENHKKHKSVLLMDNFNIFGEECLQFPAQCHLQSKYLCQVSCISNEGILFVLDKSIFSKTSADPDLSLSTNVYQMYKQRRKIAEGKQFDDQNENLQAQSGDRLKKYYERLYKLKRRNPTKFQDQKQDLYTDIEFLRKDEFISMKLKLKYQSILDKVKTMNTVTLKKVEINTKNQPKSFTKGVVDIEKKFILKQLQKKYHDRSLRNHSKMVMNALKIQASEDNDYPKHQSEYLRTKPPRVNLYNSQIHRDLVKNSPTQASEEVMNNRSDVHLYNFTNKNQRIKDKSLSNKL